MKSNNALGSWPEDGLESVSKCPVCCADKRAVLHEGLIDNVFFCAPGKWSLYKCLSCGSAYLDPRPTLETIGMAYGTYFTHSSKFNDDVSGFRYLRRAVANGYRNRRYGTTDKPALSIGYWVAKLMPAQRAIIDADMRNLPLAFQGCRLLDIGCGNGDFLLRAKGAGWDVVGVEPDPKAVRVARERGLSVRVGDITAVKDMVSAFDGITISHVIEHVHNPRELLQTCYELLKPGGWIWIETPNIEALGYRKYGKHWRGLEPPRHLVIFSDASLKSILSESGFWNINNMPYRDLCTGMYAISDTIREGRTATHISFRIRNKALCVINNARARMRNDLREFVTLKAFKPNA